MKNETNIYDIDGDIIRQAGDNHEFTIPEIQEKLKNYREKLENEQKSDNPDKHKIAVYNDYINNLANYLAFKASQLNSDELLDLIGTNNLKKTSEEDIQKALNDDTTAAESTTDEVQGEHPTDPGDNTNEESRNDEIIGRDDSNIQEERPLTQSDLLVERDNVTTNMDEYVEFEEV